MWQPDQHLRTDAAAPDEQELVPMLGVVPSETANYPARSSCTACMSTWRVHEPSGGMRQIVRHIEHLAYARLLLHVQRPQRAWLRQRSCRIHRAGHKSHREESDQYEAAVCASEYS